MKLKKKEAHVDKNELTKQQFGLKPTKNNTYNNSDPIPNKHILYQVDTTLLAGTRILKY